MQRGMLLGSLFCILYFSSCGRSPKPSTGETADQQAPSPKSDVKRLAPEGIFYLLKRTTISTDSGVTGIPVGAEVKVLDRAEGEMVSVDYRGNKLLIPASQLTNDLDLVDSLGKAHSPVVDSLPTSAAPSVVSDSTIPKIEASIQEAELKISKLEQELAASLRASSRDNSSETAKNRARQTQIQALKKQVSAWRNEISFLKR